MKGGHSIADEVLCRVGYAGDVTVLLDAETAPVVQVRTVKVFAEVKERSEVAPIESPDRKGVGKITFGLFKPLSFPDVPIPYTLDLDVAAPLRRAWDSATGGPASWLLARFPDLRPEFLVFASIEIAPEVAGRRLALAVMADLINRHVPVGGIVLLNPYPLEFLLVGDPRAAATPEQKQRGVASLKRHYSRLGLQAVESEPDLMVLQRPTRPLQPPRLEVRLPRATFRAMPDVYAYDGLY